MLALVLASVALVSGVSFLQPALPVLFVWPVASLLLGSIVGVTGWSDEQNSGAFRFWAERRMPLGKLWLAKITYGLVLVVLLVLILAAPSIIAASVAGQGPVVPMAFRSKLMQDRTFPFVEYIALWPIYGFAFGHLAGLIFRKAAVGTAVGLMTGGAIVAFWLPSLLAGGVHWYQLWIPPLLALATARSLIWSWALDQLGGRRALLRLGSGSAAVALAMVSGIAYRILEIPDGENGGADLAYRDTIPPFDTNDAGREIRRAAILLTEAKASQRTEPEPEHEPLWPDGPSQRESGIPNNSKATYFYQLQDTLTLGWPENRPDADLWFDALMANGWAESLVAAAKMPLGTVEDPSELNVNSPFRHLNALQGIETVLLARGLQLQAKGKPEGFVEATAATLGLTRNLRNKSFLICGLVSIRIENQLHLALQRWLEKLGDRPDLLREMLALLQHHDATCPKLLADGNLPEQTTLRNSINAPTQFVKQHLQYDYPSRNRETEADRVALENEVELVGFAWAVPWEKERLRRLVGLGNNRELDRAEAAFFRGLPGLSQYAREQGEYSPLRYSMKRPDSEVTSHANRRASMLLVALRLYQSEKGKLPVTLEALVPKYLPAVPLDPFDKQPFRYRISAGETLQMEQLPAPVPPTPMTFGALLGGASFEIESNLALYPPSPPEFPQPETWGGLLGGLGYAIESDPFEFKLLDPTFPPGAGAAPGGPGILVPEFRMLDLPAGRGILWSIGPDRIDDGGKRLVDPVTSAASRTAPGDLIYLVPPPVGSKR